ncbi:hypothetical protein MIZ03_2377 [Rhodoferax lithotrophicus]|uniref:Uncharacterized protein n=1 Tax=Rhodoferax lithotrophicus TaxID=2798804 RepID=A0ABM7MMF8_9BURK|nr:hypothetical protein [Rhodoferax sp. MIZ03]BCO27489.1 hypothetical protein MIZ03_2377 [Rhodoferax sp. MIZ03]
MTRGDRASIAELLGSFERGPDRRVVLAGLLASQDLANASSKTEAPAQSCRSGGG